MAVENLRKLLFKKTFNMRRGHHRAVSFWDMTYLEEIVKNLKHASVKDPSKLKEHHANPSSIWGVVADLTFGVSNSKHQIHYLPRRPQRVNGVLKTFI